MHLNQKNITRVNAAVSAPTYNRGRLQSGIVHIGVGGFHRAHQALVIQRLLEMGGNNHWGICGVGLRAEDGRIAEVFSRQDCLYTLITRHPEGAVTCEVMAQLTDFLLAPENKQAVINRMAHPDTRIVSLTITEGGYNLRSDGEFDMDQTDIQHELKNPQDPRTIYGYLLAALKTRRASGHPPFTIMSCDNIQHNGDITRKMLLSFIGAKDRELASWVEKEVAFPNSMVDRITPVTTDSELAYLKEQFDLEDEWPVTCEPFLQWVIEDNFSNGRPDFDKVAGVQFVPDVTPYEKMKIRLLNAGHSVLGIFGALMGIQTIDECVQNALLRKVLRRFWDEEATPILDEVDGIDLDEYKDTLLARFGNPNIKDKVSRICSESSAKLPKFLLPTIAENLQKGGRMEVATMVIAAWCYYADKQIDVQGRPVEVIDAMKDQLHSAARRTPEDPLAFVKGHEMFVDLMGSERFTHLYAEAVSSLYGHGDISTLLEEFQQ